MGLAVIADLVAGVDNMPAMVRVCIDDCPRNKPARWNGVLFEQCQDVVHSNGAELAARDRRRAL